MGLLNLLLGINNESELEKRRRMIDSIQISSTNQGKDMYCTKCGTIQKYGVKCKNCSNWLVEWK